MSCCRPDKPEWQAPWRSHERPPLEGWHGAKAGEGMVTMTEDAIADHRRGAYGFAIVGLEGAAPLLQPVPAGWPTFHVDVQNGPPETVESGWGPDHAAIGFNGGGVARLTRKPLAAALTLPDRPDDGAVLHPFLAGSAAIVSWWLGRDTFHGGAFVVGGDAWVILGNRECGKSSTLGWLAAHGVPVLTDDLVVVDDWDQVYAGPRCVDLREEAAAGLHMGEHLGLVGTRQRWRQVLPPTSDAVRLAGWILPAWDREIEISRMDAGAALGKITEHLPLRLVTRPERLLDFAALPCLRFARPRNWDSIGPATTGLLDRLADPAR
jgi:hypothetical protein